MKVHRFLVNEKLQKGKVEILDQSFLNQTRKVLKLRNKEQVLLFNENGNDFLSEILEYKDNRVVINILEEKTSPQNSFSKIELYCSVLKKDNFELVVQKSVELGIKKIVPIICQRTIKTNLDIDRLKRIAKEAIEQSGQNYLLDISEPISLTDALNSLPNEGVNLLMQIGGKALKQGDIGQVNRVFIGPEGGWSDLEISDISQKNFQLISLGSTVLRAETAAIVACAQVIFLHNQGV